MIGSQNRGVLLFFFFYEGNFEFLIFFLVGVFFKIYTFPWASPLFGKKKKNAHARKVNVYIIDEHGQNKRQAEREDVRSHVIMHVLRR